MVVRIVTLAGLWMLCASAVPSHASQPVPDSITAPLMKEELLGLMASGLGEGSLIGYVNQFTLSAPLTPEDSADWKRAGIPKAVILAAMARVRGTTKSNSVTLPLESNVVPLT